MPEENEPIRFNEDWVINGNQAFRMRNADEVQNEIDRARERIAARPRVIREEPILRERRRAGIGLVLDTLGFEQESVGLSRRTVEEILMKLPGGHGSNFSVVRDASTEMTDYYFQDNAGTLFSVSSHTRDARNLFEGRIPTYCSGYELVSIPMEIDVAEISLKFLLPALENNGDFITNRCASHVHVGMSPNLEICQKALALGLWFDDVFFTLSGLGGEFRGNTNNAIYARPLISGPYVRARSNFYQVLNWQRALDVKSFYDFFYCFHIDADNTANKYQSARYFAINIWSMLLHKTLEFRHLNQTFNPSYLLSFAKLCQLFTEIVLKADYKDLRKLEVANVFEEQGRNYYINKISKLVRLGEKYNCQYKLDREAEKTLLYLVDIHKPLKIKDVAVVTHLRDYSANMDLVEAGKLKKATVMPISPGNIDIHNIVNMEHVSILPERG